MSDIKKIREAVDRLEQLEAQTAAARMTLRALVTGETPKQSVAAAPIKMEGTTAEVVLKLVKALAVNGKMARTDVRTAAKRHRINPWATGQALRHLERTKVLRIDGDLISIR